MIKRRLLTGMAACALGLWANNAVAQVQLSEAACLNDGDVALYNYSYVVGTQKNGSALPADRTMAASALFAEEVDHEADLGNQFVTLGYGGSFTYHFPGYGLQDVDGVDVRVFETSWASDDCLSDGIERAFIYLSNDHGVTWSSALEICRDGAIDFADAGYTTVTDIKIVNDDNNTTPDGFDLDGILLFADCALPPGPDACYGFELVDWAQGLRVNGMPIMDLNRIDPNQMLGEPENNRGNGQYNFFSLGQNGFAVLGMGSDDVRRFIITDGTPDADIRVYETTFGDPSNEAYPEWVKVEVSHRADGDWIYVGEYGQSSNISIDLDAVLLPGQRVSYIRLSTDDRATPDDYFDVDGVEALWGCEQFDLPPAACTTDVCEGDDAPYVAGTTKSGGAISSARSIWTKALGFPQDSDALTSEANVNFVSLGYGGSMTFCGNAGGSILNGEGMDIEIIETSFGAPSCNNYREYADVHVSLDGETWYYVATGCQNFSVDISDAVDAEGNSVFLPYVMHVRVSNNNELTQTPDGYDLDGVRFTYANCEEDSEEPTEAVVDTVAAMSKMSISAFPNPTSGVVNFRFASAVEGKMELVVYNMNGQVVAKIFDDVTNANEVKVANYDLSALPNGVYLAKLTTPEGVTTSKVMLNK